MYHIGYGAWIVRTCGHCGGTGCVSSVSGGHLSSCFMCNGTGEIRQPTLPIYSNVPRVDFDPPLGLTFDPHRLSSTTAAF